MSLGPYKVTIFPALLEPTRFHAEAVSWPPPWTHQEVARKEAAPLFGPYKLREGAKRRSNEDFESMSLAVFDVDTGSEDDVAASIALALKENVASFWYTSHSFDPAAPVAKWRAVFPLARPVAAKDWARVRVGVVERFRLAVEREKCTGAAHAYYLPSCRPGGSRGTVTTLGAALDVAASSPVLTLAAAPVADDPFPPGPPEEGWEERARAKLETKARHSNEAKAFVLRSLLAGQSIVDGRLVRSESGDPPLAQLCATLVATLHPLPLQAYCVILHGTVATMQAQGYKVPWFKVRQMLLSAARKKQQNEADVEAFVEAWGAKARR